MRSRPKPVRARTRPIGGLLAAAAALLLAGAAIGPTASAAPSSPLVGAGLAPAAPVALATRATTATQGLSPAEIHSAYGLPARGAHGQTIAVISSYDDPHAQADLNAYDKYFALPPCTAQNRCLRKLNQQGKASPLPPTDPSGGTWITESALGTEVAHGVCQSCEILLVEASTATKPDFSDAVNAAAGAGATVIVTTFTPREDIGDSGYLSDYSHPRAAVVSAVGDPVFNSKWGYTGALNFPSSLPNVLAVGGTELHVSKGGGYGGEHAWSGTVSGCSLYQQAASWQAQAARAGDCGAMRPVADLAAVADPGAIVHITGAGQPGGPWYVAEGTSFSAPIIAGVIGLAGSVGEGESQLLYKYAQSENGVLHNIRTGADAPDCIAAICNAGPGWDGPTGFGTPDGLAAFLPSGGALSRSHPQITISVPDGRLQVNAGWITHVAIENGNPVAVRASIVIQSHVRTGGRLRLITFASTNVSLAPLADANERVLVTHSRSVLKGLGGVRGSIHVQVRGPAGGVVTVVKDIQLLAP